MRLVLLLLCCCSITVSSFLLDGNSKGNTDPVLMTDSHFTILLNLLTEERKAREQLQQYVVQLKQDMANKEIQTNCSCTSESIAFDAFNKSIQHELSDMKRKLDNLEMQNRNLLKTQADAAVSHAHVENEVDLIKHSINNISDFNFTIGLQNMTKQYMQQLHTTDTKLQAIEAEARARSNDIMALLNMVQSHESKSERVIKELCSDFNITIQDIGSRLQNRVNNINSTLQQWTKLSDEGVRNVTNQCIQQLHTTDTKLQAVEAETRARSNDIMALLNMVQSHENKSERLIKELSSDFNNTLQDIESRLHNRIDSVNSTISPKINQMSDKVALRAQPSSSVTVNPSTIIKFGSIQMSEGISDLSSFRQTGKFVCKNPGVYIISVQINTNTNNNEYFFLFKTNIVLSRPFRFHHDYAMTMMTTVVEKLNINDEIWVQSGFSDMQVYGGYESSINIVQIR